MAQLFESNSFLAGKSSSAGVVAEDSLSRSQLVLVSNGNVVQMGTEGTGIAPGEAITRKWALYPVVSLDYFDFLNQLRKDWR